ncbi:hypothetical protein HC028_05190 [Planosporangium flavigriseum]|uniref:Uncharacterized protein n=1 Tax=Planosporangium flavigriseum TaxID=373681 RepID=A0A8J3LJZ5_9ACTN|nr:hypothetical protein [Planosporangium flavigriseum]NJC63904.1 hypothetical protein [Planosporangium flavigriseum]GIG74618.1 hypothetical protein Pfl04_30220 [Planosporangium flavigriseum]
MTDLFRRRAAAVLRGVTFSESRSEVCTATCRADARLDRARTTAASQFLGWR